MMAVAPLLKSDATAATYLVGEYQPSALRLPSG